MLYCFIETTKNSFYIKDEIAYCKKQGNGCFYDEESGLFTDFNHSVINIKGIDIFVRSGVTQTQKMIEEIQKAGGIPICTNEQSKTVKDWLTYYNPNRKILLVTGKDLLDTFFIRAIEEKFGTEIFFKTKEKNYSEFLKTEFLKDSESLVYRTLLHHLNDEFIISEKVTVEEDEIGVREYRCFVWNGQVINISRCTDDIYHTIDESVFALACQMVDSLEKTSFPPHYVVDIFEYTDSEGNKKLDVIEFNPIQASGTYLYNTIVDLEGKDVLHLNKHQLPVEKEDIPAEDFFETGTIKSKPSIVYNAVGTFANDLRSIYITGEVGMGYTSLPNELMTDVLGSHGVLLKTFQQLTPLDDEDLLGTQKIIKPE